MTAIVVPKTRLWLLATSVVVLGASFTTLARASRPADLKPAPIIASTITPTGSNANVSANLVIVPVGPLPTVVLIANPAAITTGQSATLTWVSVNATGCTASGGWSGSKDTHGSVSTGTITSAGTTDYTLTCTGTGGSKGASTSLTVTQATAAP
jgi:hypothetical protein